MNYKSQNEYRSKRLRTNKTYHSNHNYNLSNLSNLSNLNYGPLPDYVKDFLNDGFKDSKNYFNKQEIINIIISLYQLDNLIEFNQNNKNNKNNNQQDYSYII
jgi:hypothetical protein